MLLKFKDIEQLQECWQELRQEEYHILRVFDKDEPARLNYSSEKYTQYNNIIDIIKLANKYDSNIMIYARYTTKGEQDKIITIDFEHDNNTTYNYNYIRIWIE